MKKSKDVVKSEKKNKSLIMVIVVVLVIVLALLLGLSLNKNSSKLKDNATKTEIGETKSYRMDLRIYGEINKTRVNKIIMVNNYQNNEKNIQVTDTTKEQGKELEEYIIKDKKSYQIVNKELKEVDKVIYENTDIYLSGVKKVGNLKEEKEETIGEKKYKVYKGKVDKSIINDILKETDLNYQTENDAECKILVSEEGYVYQVHYTFDKLTVYASYFGYNKISGVNLDMYKENK